MRRVCENDKDRPEVRAALELAEAAVAMLKLGKAAPLTHARLAFRADLQSEPEERYVRALMRYYRCVRKERSQAT